MLPRNYQQVRSGDLHNDCGDVLVPPVGEQITTPALFETRIRSCDNCPLTLSAAISKRNKGYVANWQHCDFGNNASMLSATNMRCLRKQKNARGEIREEV
ncbi:hypothetical protein GGE07_004653 [Sinorhizobium terangae]|nr:hypothetical protein [Sinorhizobium terangae]